MHFLHDYLNKQEDVGVRDADERGEDHTGAVTAEIITPSEMVSATAARAPEVAE